MDRFKFRVWGVVDSPIMSGNKKREYGWFRQRDFMIRDGSCYVYEPSFSFGGRGSWEIWDDVKIMQCTGLKDKNGVLIYEGDLLKSKEDDFMTMPDDNVFQVSWTLSGFTGVGNEYYRSLSHPEKFEVIGNIYQNKELLE